jgi:hypothetical protein
MQRTVHPLPHTAPRQVLKIITNEALPYILTPTSSKKFVPTKVGLKQTARTLSISHCFIYWMRDEMGEWVDGRR